MRLMKNVVQTLINSPATRKFIALALSLIGHIGSDEG